MQTGYAVRDTLAKQRWEDGRWSVPKAVDFPRYNMKFSGVNVILRGIFHVVSCFPLHFMLYHGNLDYFSDSVQYCTVVRRKAHRN